AKSSRFHTGANGARRAPNHAPPLMIARRRREGAAFRRRSAIALLVQNASGTPPRDSVVSGNTETATGVTASNPHSSTSVAKRIASVRVARAKPGGALSTGTFTRQG